MQRRDFLSAMFALAVADVRRDWGRSAYAAKNILDYGAHSGGKELNTESIQRAVTDAHSQGGGVVLVPRGTFLTGKLELLSRVTLYLDVGATLLGSKSISDYGGGPGRHLIFATNADDVGIAGSGRIDGQGRSFWEPSGEEPMPSDELWRGVASHKLKPKKAGRPSPMIFFKECRGVQIRDVRIDNSPGWTLHAFNCDDVTIERIAINNPVDGPNTDGIDLTGCQNVEISNCIVQTGDDAICLKTTDPNGGEPRLVKGVKVSGCSLTTCCNGFKVGTESEGGFENVIFSNSTVYSGDVAYDERVISGVALEIVDGGWIDGVQVIGIQMERVRAPIFIRLGNRKDPYKYSQRGLRHVSIEDIHATDTLMASCITGFPGTIVQDVVLSNVNTSNIYPSRAEWLGGTVPERPNGYPEVWMFGMLPASGLYARHANGLLMQKTTFSTGARETRPTVIFDDVKRSRISGFTSTPVIGSMPIIQLVDCSEIQIVNSIEPQDTSHFLEVEGSRSTGILLVDDNLRGVGKPVETSHGASPGAVTWQTPGTASK